MYNFNHRLSGWTVFIMRVKLIAFVITLTFMQTFANVKAQLVTLKLEKATLEQVFEKINAQTGYDFLFTTSQLKRKTPSTIDLATWDLIEFLQNISVFRPLVYSI